MSRLVGQAAFTTMPCFENIPSIRSTTLSASIFLHAASSAMNANASRRLIAASYGRSRTDDAELDPVVALFVLRLRKRDLSNDRFHAPDRRVAVLRRRVEHLLFLDVRAVGRRPPARGVGPLGTGPDRLDTEHEQRRLRETGAHRGHALDDQLSHRGVVVRRVAAEALDELRQARGPQLANVLL